MQRKTSTDYCVKIFSSHAFASLKNFSNFCESSLSIFQHFTAAPCTATRIILNTLLWYKRAGLEDAQEKWPWCAQKQFLRNKCNPRSCYSCVYTLRTAFVL